MGYKRYQSLGEFPSILHVPWHLPLTTFPLAFSNRLRLLTVMKFSTFILSILSAATYVLAENTNATTKTANLLKGLQMAPTRLARLSVLKDNKDVSISYPHCGR